MPTPDMSEPYGDVTLLLAVPGPAKYRRILINVAADFYTMFNKGKKEGREGGMKWEE